MAITINVIVSGMDRDPDAHSDFLQVPVADAVISILNNDATTVIGTGTTVGGFKQITGVTPTAATANYIYTSVSCTGYKTKVAKIYYATSSDTVWASIRLVTDVTGGV